MLTTAPFATPARHGEVSRSRDRSEPRRQTADHVVRPARETRFHDLRAEVRASLRSSGYAALALVACEVDQHTVILHGRVPSYHLKQLAQVFAQRVEGVGRIDNRLEVLSRASL
jgi:osmotically-inducible protein OsmY